MGGTGTVSLTALEAKLAKMGKGGSLTTPSQALPSVVTDLDGACKLVDRLAQKAGVVLPEDSVTRANIMVGVVGSSEALHVARRLGAGELMGQLSRMEEADRVLQLAWEAGLFEDCMHLDKPSDPQFGRRGRQFSLTELEQTIKELGDRALEILAEQYGDLHVRVKQFSGWEDTRVMKKCPVRTLGGPAK